MSLFYRDDIGAQLVISTNNTDLGADTVFELRMEKPSGVTVALNITPEMVDLATGVITYSTVDGDLDEVGEYKVQVHGDFIDGTDEVSDIDTFEVFERLIVT